MTVTVSPYVVIVVLSLALFGVVFVWRWARDAARDARAWWQGWRARRRRGQPRGISDDCWFGTHEDCDGCDCACGHPPFALEELPPERSAEALGFTGSDRNTDDLMDGGGLWHGSYAPESAEVRQWRRDEARRERLAAAAELEHRAAYEACGFDYPSGLLARVREAAR